MGKFPYGPANLLKFLLYLLITVAHLIILLHASRKSIVSSIQSPNFEEKRNLLDTFISGKVILSVYCIVSYPDPLPPAILFGSRPNKMAGGSGSGYETIYCIAAIFREAIS